MFSLLMIATPSNEERRHAKTQRVIHAWSNQTPSWKVNNNRHVSLTHDQKICIQVLVQCVLFGVLNGLQQKYKRQTIFSHRE